MHKYTYTIFTPTFNRENTLKNVYNSITKQTFTDFEWIIVDDGSTDNTRELVNSWITDKLIPIKYYYQENAGKHRARNFAVQKAAGKFFFTWDSDDVCLPEALEKMLIAWNSIPDADKKHFAGVTGLCSNKEGKIIGTPFPKDIFDSNMFDIREKYGVTGEKCGFQRTDVMREYPFPEIENEKFITEGIVWFRIAQKYKTRFFNEVLRIYEPREDGLSKAGIRLLMENPKGKALFCNEYMAMTTNPSRLIKTAANYVRSKLHDKAGIKTIFCEAQKPFFVALTFPIGLLLFLNDKRKYSKP